MKFLMGVAFCFSLLVFPAVAAELLPPLEIQQKFMGRWVRPDGGYVIHVRDIKPGGAVDAGYYNPNKIHVAEAHVAVWKGFNQLFIKLDDKGYPGSTYTLYYFADQDQMAGFYYQAAANQIFEVLFVRMK
ncbi:MAG: hypothetical protein JW902_18110 [Syntrophaceae bacterium]|nr:hypothetical protein [Syntrophaceae bacterium]